MSEKFYQAFVDQIGNEELTRSINNIKQTAAAIWTNEVRIIKDYTDHGPEHSERIFEKLHKILWPGNAIKLLSDYELYVLILGVILHDIGMQCDVKKCKKIKNVAAEQFGASFQVVFSEGPASSYSIEEQNELRKNHHLLTAAWLDCIFRNENLLLPTIALDSVPTELREDLIDVCRFHSKLNIFDCPKRNDITHVRTRLIAALLRLGDELDIDRFRVDINTVKLFGYDIGNSFFWYLHEYTVVDIENHLITLRILLNKKDYDDFADYFKEEVIDEFEKKNGILTEIIMSNDINIGISRQSEVKCIRYQKALPDEISDYIKSQVKKKKKRINNNSTQNQNNNKSHNNEAPKKPSGNKIPPKHTITKEVFSTDFQSYMNKTSVSKEEFSVKEIENWEWRLVKTYKEILDEILDNKDPSSPIAFAINPSLLDDSIINAFIELKRIKNSSDAKCEPNSIRIVAHIMYWFLRIKPIQIFCSPGKWIEDVIVKDSSNYNKEDLEKANRVLAWKITHINEYVALTFALAYIFDFEKMALAEEDFKRFIGSQNRRSPFGSIDEMLDLIIDKLLYIISYKSITPETLEYFLTGCMYSFPYALNDENVDCL